MNRRVKIALTMGCPKGVGPELAVSAAEKLSEICDITIYGDEAILSKAAALKNISRKVVVREIASPGASEMPLTEEEAGKLSFDILERATQDVLAGDCDALVTCPINKRYWNKAGIPFIGHTEYLTLQIRRRLECKVKSAMMMASPGLKVTLATIHESIRDVADKLTTEKIISAAEVTYDALKKYFDVTHPRIAVAALNPHCGDGGLMGDEEEKIIRPAIDRLIKKDINAAGPFPADSIFHQAASGRYDAVIAMYHDQGLAAIKTLDYKHTVNITLGIPIIRTSVDHGTAEDIAWKGIADDANLIAAIEMAVNMVKIKNLIFQRRG